MTISLNTEVEAEFHPTEIAEAMADAGDEEIGQIIGLVISIGLREHRRHRINAAVIGENLSRSGLKTELTENFLLDILMGFYDVNHKNEDKFKLGVKHLKEVLDGP